MGDERPSFVIGAVASSLAVHGYLVFGLWHQPIVARPEIAPSAVRIEVKAPPPPPPPEPTKPEPEPAAEPKREIVRRNVPAPATAGEPEAPPPETTGVTLDAEGDRSFEAPAGNGESRSAPLGPIAPPAPVPTRAPKAAARPPQPPPPPPVPKTVALADLSRRPQPPALDASLERNYPAEARRRGIGGRAVVRARIEADGRVQSARVSSETDSGFGEACRRTLIGTRWSAPLDRDGKPVATEITYACRFRVSD